LSVYEGMSGGAAFLGDPTENDHEGDAQNSFSLPLGILSHHTSVIPTSFMLRDTDENGDFEYLAVDTSIDEFARVMNKPMNPKRNACWTIPAFDRDDRLATRVMRMNSVLQIIKQRSSRQSSTGT